MPGIQHFFERKQASNKIAANSSSSSDSRQASGKTGSKKTASGVVIKPNCDGPNNDNYIDDDDDDDVIIIEELCAVKKSDPKQQPQTYLVQKDNPSKPNNELTPSMQSSRNNKTNRRQIVADLDVTRTPNVPRIRGSFFYRKYRDISNCPITPATPKPSRNTPSRLNGQNSGKNHKNLRSGQSRSSGRSSNSKINQNELIGSDFSTPKTTRTLLTPTTMRRNNSTRASRVPRLIYPPLELDNESSSESSDSIMRRRNNKRQNSQDFTTPLAIEAAPNDTTPKSRSPDDAKLERQLVGADDKISEQPELETLERKRPKIVKDDSPRSDSRRDTIITEIDEVSQCITPPITPEKTLDEESKSVPKLPAFIPGNCNIDEVLKLYGSESNKNPETKSAELRTDSKAD